MSSRKRSFRALEGDSSNSEPSLLSRLRNMWQFANLCQWIYTFGKAAKIDESIDIEDIETECLKPSSTVLDDIALALLKLVSSHRGLTHDIFDEQARKQYLSKAADQNPFGNGDTATRFTDFDIFTKIRVLQQLTQWTMIHPERIRDKMEEQKDVEQTTWRIEPYGWDAEDRTYYVLDDNRVYRMTEPPPPAPKPKRTKNWRAGRRSSKRRRTNQPVEEPDSDVERDAGEEAEPEDDGLGGMKWECLGVTLEDVQSLVEGFRKSRDENERILRSQLEDHLVPILERQEQSRKRKEIQRERELTNLAKMANAKRSSRIAHKVEQQKQEERAKEEDDHRREAEAAHRREEAARLKIEKERNRRLASREQRFREREARRLQHEEELAQLSEDSRQMADGENNGRISERRLKVEIERNKQALKDLEDEEEDWVFDCVCGLYGQVDDGTHSVACERCNVWQHSKCLGISEADAERPEFHFVCSSCVREQEAKSRPRPTIKLKVNHQGSPRTQSQPSEANQITGFAHPMVSSSQDTDSTAKETGQLSPQSQADLRIQPVVVGLPKVSMNNNNPNSLRPTFDPHTSFSSLNSESHRNGSPAIASPTKSAFRDLGRMGSPSVGNAIGTSPMTITTPTNGIHSLQSDRAIESVLSTPSINRDKYRAAHLPNGTLPAQAGLSPTKHSPPPATDPGNAAKINTTTPILPPVTNLSPSPQRLILTPPSKSSEPIVPLERR